MKVEQLQRDARAEFAEMFGHDTCSPRAFIENLTLRVYAAAIEDAKGVIPEKATEEDGWFIAFKKCCPGDDIAEGFNHYRAEALNRLDGLLT